MTIDLTQLAFNVGVGLGGVLGGVVFVRDSLERRRGKKENGGNGFAKIVAENNVAWKEATAVMKAQTEILTALWRGQTKIETQMEEVLERTRQEDVVARIRQERAN
ncbi:MAG: hypothetical protein C4521_12340 [Actinobacteria bacterium]|nr:MAG: hypothetical protein C4521_12340 [Actinomycetota bacterium]